jgi:hypothetical protein
MKIMVLDVDCTWIVRCAYLWVEKNDIVVFGLCSGKQFMVSF